MKSVQVRSYSSPYFPVFSPNTGKYGPEITPYLDTSRRDNSCDCKQVEAKVKKELPMKNRTDQKTYV